MLYLNMRATIILAIVNAKSARTWGFEETFNMRVAPPLTVGVNAGYLDAQYTEFRDSEQPGTVQLQPQRYDDDQLAEVANRDDGGPRSAADRRAASDRQPSSVLYQRSQLRTSGRPLPAATQRVGLLAHQRPYRGRCRGQPLDPQFFTNNVFNRSYVTYGESGAGTGNVLAWGNPRIMGGEITFKF